MKTQIKICGLTNLADAQVAVEAGVDLLGFILYPRSPRFVEPVTVAQIVAALRRTYAQLPRCVGVFVNVPVDQVRQILDETGLDLAQLHGDETPGAVAALPGQAYKALRPASAGEALDLASCYAPLGLPAGPSLLIDAYSPQYYGGTGERADWQAAAEIAARYPGVLLAGGLTPANVAAAVETARPWGVDVASGVEASPGRKDHAAIQAFIEAVRAAR